MRILIVEDEERLRTGLKHLIESIGPDFKVVGAAANGVEGLERIEQLWPDVVFVDIRMPEMDGFEMIERATSGSAHPFKGAFVIISAYSNFSYVRRALRQGVADYLLKPVSYQEVEQVLFRLANIPQNNPFAQGCLDEQYPVPENAAPLVKSAVEMIRTGYAGPLSLDAVAEKLGVSCEYFSQTFSKQMSVPFSRYLKSYRMDVAKRLLLERRFRMQDIASMTGYQNPKYFSRVFREVMHMSPSEYVEKYGSPRDGGGRLNSRKENESPWESSSIRPTGTCLAKRAIA